MTNLEIAEPAHDTTKRNIEKEFHDIWQNILAIRFDFRLYFDRVNDEDSFGVFQSDFEMVGDDFDLCERDCVCPRRLGGR